MKNSLLSQSIDDTHKIGAEFAKLLKRGDIITFSGELGAGKTELIRGICSYFKVNERVTSPTFTIINIYNGELDDEDLEIFHLDLYRIQDTAELTEIGFSECLENDESIKFIEWHNKAGDKIKHIDYSVSILLDESDENKRIINVDYFFSK